MRPWQQFAPVYSGSINLSTGNGQIVLPICGWGGLSGGLQFPLVFNSQSTRSSAVGSKWTHSYRWMIFATAMQTGGASSSPKGATPNVHTPPITQATVVSDDGTEMVYPVSSGVFVPPVGCYDALTHNADGTWTLLRKGGATYQFNSTGLLTSITDLAGNVTTIGYSGGLIATVTDSADRQISLGYTGGILSSVTDCVGRVWNFSWNTSYDTQAINGPLLNGSQYSRVIGYDANNNVNALTDCLGKTWLYNYSTTGNIFLNTTDPDVHSWSLAYGTLAAGISWPTTAAVQANWTNSNSKITKYAFDATGRAVGVNDATNRLSVFAWDSSNNRTDQWTPSGAHTQWGHDSRGNVTLITDAFGKQTIKTYDYNNGDALNYVKGPLGHETFHNYPTAAPFNGNLLSVKDARGHITNYAYWPGGLVKQKTDAENRVTNFTYDQWGHPYQTTVVKDANTSFVATTTYSKDSLLTQRTDALSRVTNFTYDDWGRLTQKAYPTSGRTSVVLTLDVEGRITQAVDATGTRTFNAFDAWGRCKSMNDPMAGSHNPLLASYDGEGNLLTQMDVTGRTLSYSYDDANRLKTVSDDGNTTQAVYTYDTDGAKQTLTMPNGTLATWAYTYGRLTGVTHMRVSDNSVIASYTTDATSFDDDSSLLHFTDNIGDVTALAYDETDNLLTETRTGIRSYSGAYTYDKTNLRKMALTITDGSTSHDGSYTYDGTGQLSQVIDSATSPSTNEVYAWYNDGTLSSYPLPSNASVTVQPEYDEEGNLVKLSHVSGGATTTVYEYGYAYDGKRRWKKDYTNSTSKWYPCGVACLAGELAELTSDLSGQTWNVSSLYLPDSAGCVGGAKPIRRRNVGSNGIVSDEYHHADLFGVNGIITDANATILSGGNNVYDRFGVPRYLGASAQIVDGEPATTPYRFCKSDEDGLLQDCSDSAYLPSRDLLCLKRPPQRKPAKSKKKPKPVLKYTKDFDCPRKKGEKLFGGWKKLLSGLLQPHVQEAYAKRCLQECQQWCANKDDSIGSEPIAIGNCNEECTARYQHAVTGKDDF